MSIRVMNWVWQHSTNSGGALLLMLALADFADDDGVCWPAVERLARKSRISPRQVRYLLDRAVAAGEIEVQRSQGGAHEQTNRYRLLCGRTAANTAPVTPADTAPVTPAKSAPLATGAKTARVHSTAAVRVHPIAPEPSFNSSLNSPSGELISPAGAHTRKANPLGDVIDAIRGRGGQVVGTARDGHVLKGMQPAIAAEDVADAYLTHRDWAPFHVCEGGLSISAIVLNYGGYLDWIAHGRPPRSVGPARQPWTHTPRTSTTVLAAVPPVSVHTTGRRFDHVTEADV